MTCCGGAGTSSLRGARGDLDRDWRVFAGLALWPGVGSQAGGLCGN